MPYFAIHCIDKPDSVELRAANRPDHIDYIKRIIDRVFAAGPLLSPDGDPIGTLLIIDFPDRKSAIEFAASDPYSLVGLFSTVAITPWRKVYPV